MNLEVYFMEILKVENLTKTYGSGENLVFLHYKLSTRVGYGGSPCGWMISAHTGFVLLWNFVYIIICNTNQYEYGRECEVCSMQNFFPDQNFPF